MSRSRGSKSALERIKEIERQATSVDPGFYEWTPFLLEAFHVMREIAKETMDKLAEGNNLQFNDTDVEFQKRMSK